MALNTFNPPYAPSPGTKYAPEIKKKRAEFGDGYVLEMPDGSNPIKRKPKLTWDTLTEDEAQAIVDFFEAHVAIPFYYALRDGVTRKWLLTSFDRTFGTPNEVIAEFEQYFGLDV